QVWALATGERQFSLLHSNRVYSATFSSDGHLIATTSSDNLVHLWSAKNGDSLQQLPIRHRGQVTGPHPRFSPKGDRLLTRIATNIVRIWDPVTGVALGQPLRHEEEITSFDFSPDGRRILTTSYLSLEDRRILTLSETRAPRLWDASTGVAVGPALKHAGFVICSAFSPD